MTAFWKVDPRSFCAVIFRKCWLLLLLLLPQSLSVSAPSGTTTGCAKEAVARRTAAESVIGLQIMWRGGLIWRKDETNETKWNEKPGSGNTAFDEEIRLIPVSL